MVRVVEIFPVPKDIPGARGGSLSGGQPAPIAIGRVLVIEPECPIRDRGKGRPIGELDLGAARRFLTV